MLRRTEGCRGPLFVLFLLMSSVKVPAQSASASIASCVHPHIRLTGYSPADSVRVEDILKAGGISSAHPSITITGFRYSIPGLCIGGTYQMFTRKSSVFTPYDLEVIKQLRKGHELQLDSIVAVDQNGHRVNLKMFSFRIK
jgi:hypothetical protein